MGNLTRLKKNGVTEVKDRAPGLVFRLFYLKVLLVVLGVVAIGLSIRFGWHCLINLDMFMVKPGAFAFDLPSWAKLELLDEIKNSPILDGEHSIFEKDLTSKIAEEYSGKPWVEKVHYVKKEFPDNIKIKFSLRRPFAVVETRGDTSKSQGRSFCLLDEECVRLPEEYYYWPDGDPEVFYVRSNKVSKLPARWERWDDAGIRAGVKLVGFLRKNEVYKLLKIRVVDVSEVNTRHDSAESEIVLMTQKGTKIKWGRASLHKVHGELSDAEKLQNLLSVAKAEGRNLSRMEYVDLRWDTPQGKLRY